MQLTQGIKFNSAARSREARGAKGICFLIYQVARGAQGVVLNWRSQALLGCNSSELFKSKYSRMLPESSDTLSKREARLSLRPSRLGEPCVPGEFGTRWHTRTSSTDAFKKTFACPIRTIFISFSWNRTRIGRAGVEK